MFIDHYKITTYYINTIVISISQLLFKKMEISTEEVDLAKQNKPKEEQEELISDFSQMFKGKGLARKPKLTVRQAQPTPNWLLQIPAKLQITKEEMRERKVLNQKKWKAIVNSRKVEQRLIASAVSAWNYLFSTKGIGTSDCLNINQAIKICEKKGVRYQTQNQYQRAEIVLTAFKTLCSNANTNAEGKVIIKPTTPGLVEGVEEQYLDYFLKGLANEETFYVFITYSNVWCPIGFDKTPLVPLDAFKRLQQIDPKKIQLWIINGSVQRFEPSFVSKRWSDIHKNLTTVWPNYVDLEEPKKGPQRMEAATEQTQKQERGCSHCIIQFKKTLNN